MMQAMNSRFEEELQAIKNNFSRQQVLLANSTPILQAGPQHPHNMHPLIRHHPQIQSMQPIPPAIFTPRLSS